MSALNFDNPFHIVVALVAAAVVGVMTVLSVIRTVRIAVESSRKFFPDRKGVGFKAQRFLVATLISLIGFSIVLVSSPIGYLRFGYRKLKSLPVRWRVWREKRRPKPVVYKNSRHGVTVLVPTWAYDRAMAWHRQGVKLGYRLPDDKLVVRPTLVFYDSSVPVGQKMRVAYSSDETRLYQITLECWIEERPNIYIPFVSSPKQMGRDSRLFSCVAPEFQEALRVIRNPKTK